MAYPNRHIDTEIPHVSRDHVIVPDTVKVTFSLYTESSDKTRRIIKNVGGALVKKKVLMPASKEIYAINNSDIYDTDKVYHLRVV